jgi:hypothetical protein
MFELYVRCPSTGEPVYAGLQPVSERGAAQSAFMGRSICPACGSEHEWQAAAVWSAIPVTLSPVDEPPFGAPILEGEATALPYEAQSFEPPSPVLAWPKVA